LIGYQLAGENANECNLITGTRYLNVTGMLPFENQVADYVKSTDNHVLYRVTPVFDGGDLVAQGVQMEALSVEDDTVCFNVFVYNVQPGVEIDYATGESWLAEEAVS
jgi:DNA-entry nuclease